MINRPAMMLRDNRRFLLPSPGTAQSGSTVQRGARSTNRGAQLTKRGSPLTSRGARLTKRGNPLTSRGVHLSKRGKPLTIRGACLASRGVPLTKRGHDSTNSCAHLPMPNSLPAGIMSYSLKGTLDKVLCEGSQQAEILDIPLHSNRYRELVIRKVSGWVFFQLGRGVRSKSAL